MTRRKIDRGIVELAIAEIEATGKPVTIKGLAEVTGYSSGGLNLQDYLKKYVKTYKPKAQLPSPIKQVVIEHTVDSYKAHITSQYFSSPEKREDVASEMLAEVESFKASIFNQAMNQLLVEGQLVESHLNDFIVSKELHNELEDAEDFADYNDWMNRDKDQMSTSVVQGESQTSESSRVFNEVSARSSCGLEIRLTNCGGNQQLAIKLLKLFCGM